MRTQGVKPEGVKQKWLAGNELSVPMETSEDNHAVEAVNLSMAKESRADSPIQDFAGDSQFMTSKHQTSKMQMSQITGVVPSRMKLPKPYAKPFFEKLRQKEINRANNQLLSSLMSAQPLIDNKLNGYTARVVRTSH